METGTLVTILERRIQGVPLIL